MKNHAVPTLYSNEVSPTGKESPIKKDMKNEVTAITANDKSAIRPTLLGGIAIQKCLNT
ncbi:hypothetical protein KL86DYS2_13243 [uncultured Dysgonomonas sp.]|uniref:Uncharacterized protein n=1 Tax=uncultured Dysgonomonas sp. TaxID=206096 RepID=A0A212K858_9BACT|nr:hypothetical protein KL86DYS2_13243 [uncultured Dysgonomonas sp.]